VTGRMIAGGGGVWGVDRVRAWAPLSNRGGLGGGGAYAVSMESPLPLKSTKRRRWHGRSLASRCSRYGEIWPGRSLGVQ